MNEPKQLVAERWLSFEAAGTLDLGAKPSRPASIEHWHKLFWFQGKYEEGAPQLYPI